MPLVEEAVNRRRDLRCHRGEKNRSKGGSVEGTSPRLGHTWGKKKKKQHPHRKEKKLIYSLRRHTRHKDTKNKRTSLITPRARRENRPAAGATFPHRAGKEGKQHPT